MSGVGGPPGNDYGTKKYKIWGETLRRIAIQDPEKLRKIAEALYQKASEGDVQAVKEIGDRLDGKAHQSMDVQADVEVKGFTWQK